MSWQAEQKKIGKTLLRGAGARTGKTFGKKKIQSKRKKVSERHAMLPVPNINIGKRKKRQTEVFE